MKIIKRLLLLIAVGVVVTLLINPGIFSDIVSGITSTSGKRPSLSEMSEEIKRSTQNKFDTDDDYSGYRIKVQKVSLIEVGTNSYKAYVDIQYLNEKERTISADVHVSDDQYFWEFPTGTFLFLFEDFQWDFSNGEDEEGDSDADYYAALDRLKTDKSTTANYTTIPNDVEVWILFGRSITEFAYPVYEAPVGFVQFEVVVDKEGNVIEADKYTVDKSSVPMDYIKACQAAAKHLKFEPADKASIITVSFSVK